MAVHDTALAPRRSPAAPYAPGILLGGLLLVQGAAFTAPLAAQAASVSAPRVAQRASAAEVAGRLLAPCCWIQTLDVHDSPLATELRAEISRRLAQGEESSAIEDDLAARYTERIRAVPRGQDPRDGIPALIAVGMSISLATLFVLGWRWKRSLARRAEADPAADGPAPAASDVYDAQVDAELARLEEN